MYENLRLRSGQLSNLRQSLANNFSNPVWVNLCRQLGAVTSRPAVAVDLHKGKEGTQYKFSKWENLYSDGMLADNVYHVRKLFLGLLSTLDNDDCIAALEEKERELIMVLAAIRGGATDPTPLILCVDYVLRELWRLLLAMKDGRDLAGSWTAVQCKLSPSLTTLLRYLGN